jgi:hypothetical protein
MSPVSVDTPSKNLNTPLNSQSSGQHNAGRQDPFEGVTVPSSPSRAAQFSVTEEKQTAGSPDLKAQKAKLEAKFQPEIDIKTLASQRPELRGCQEILEKYENDRPSWQAIGAIAKKLQALSDKDIPILPQTIEGTMGDFRKEVIEAYKLSRKIILNALSKSETIGDFIKLIYILDCDGNILPKTLIKTQNSDASTPLEDKVALRILIWISHMLHGKLAMNTQRVGLFANMSVQGSEGPGIVHEGIVQKAQRTVSQISDCRHEVGIYNDQDPLSGVLDIFGLGAAVSHKPGQPLKLDKKLIQFSEIIDEMNKTHGFLDKFNAIMKEKALRVLEYKSIPEYLMSTNGESTLEHYLKFTDLTELAFKEKWTDQKYAQELRALNIPMTSKHKELLLALEDPANPAINIKTFSATLRYGRIVCLVPHCINPDNILDEASKMDFIKLIARTLRSPELKDFLATKYSFPKDQDIFNINNISASHIDFSGQNPVNTQTGEVYKNFNRLVESLKKDEKEGKIPAANSNQSLKLISNNPNPYFEFTVNTGKDKGASTMEEAQKNNEFLLGGGDSYSDGALITHALLAGGAGLVARGQIDYVEHLGSDLIKHLTAEAYQTHDFALESLGSGRYKIKKTGEEIGHDALAKKLIEHFTNPDDPRIVRQPSVHLNVCSLAGPLLEIAQALKIPGLKDVVGLKDPSKFSLDVDEKAFWVKQFQEKRNVASMPTPLIPELWETICKENEEKGGNAKPFAEISPAHKLIAGLPLIGPLISMDNPIPAFNNVFKIITSGLIAGGGIAAAATLMGKKSGEQAGMNIQKWVSRLQAGVVGLSFYLMTPHQYTPKLFGKLIEVGSTFFKESIWGDLLGSLSGINAAGIAVNDAQSNCLNIDDYVDAKEENSVSKKAFKDPAQFHVIREASTQLTEQRRKDLNYFRADFLGGALSKLGPIGDFISGIVPDAKMALTMAGQFFSEPGLRVGVLKNIFLPGSHGVATRMGKNNGQKYDTLASEPHLYAAVAASTVLSSFVGLIANKFKATGLSRVFAGLANCLPSIALINHAKTASINVDGELTSFTDRYGKQRKFSPQHASFWQLAGGYTTLFTSLFTSLAEKGPVTHKLHILAKVGNKIGWGLFFNGLFKGLIPILDNNVVTRAIQQKETYVKNIEANTLTPDEAKLVTHMATANKLSLPATAQNNAVSLNLSSNAAVAKLPASPSPNEFKISTPQKTVPEKELVAVRK